MPSSHWPASDRLGVRVAVEVTAAVTVAVALAVAVAVGGVPVGVFVAVFVGVSVAVLVAVLVAVSVAVFVGVFVSIGPGPAMAGTGRCMTWAPTMIADPSSTAISARAGPSLRGSAVGPADVPSNAITRRKYGSLALQVNSKLA